MPTNIQAATSISDCKDAPRGHFTDTDGSTSPKECPRGKYANSEGLSQCRACAAGKYNLDTGQSSENACRQCPAGRYGSIAATSSQCTGPCPVGKYCPRGSSLSTANDCGGVDKYCPGGSSNPKKVTSGYFSTPEDAHIRRREHQEICPRGHYCQGGRKYECQAGRYGGEKGLSTAACTGQCLDGFYCPSGSISSAQQFCSADLDPTWYCEKGIRKNVERAIIRHLRMVLNLDEKPVYHVKMAINAMETEPEPEPEHGWRRLQHQQRLVHPP